MPLCNLIYPIGIFGKLPCNGDFFHRGLSFSVFEKIDDFHNQCLHSLREKNHDNFNSAFLEQSPIFLYIAAENKNQFSYIAVMSPSYDKVGRLYPITVLVPLHLSLRNTITFSTVERTLTLIQETIDHIFIDQTLDVSSLEQEIEKNIDMLFNALNNDDQTTPQNHSINDLTKEIRMEQAKKTQNIEELSQEKHEQPSFFWNIYFKPKDINRFAGLPDPERYIDIATRPNNTANKPRYKKNLMERRQLKIGVSHESQLFTENEILSLSDENHINLDDNTPASTYHDPLESAQLISYTGKTGLNDEYNDDTNRDVMSNTQSDGMGPYFSDICPTATFTHTGNVREVNEDSYLADPFRGLWLIADGVGGLKRGEFASQCVVDFCSQTDLSGDISQRTKQLVAQIDSSNQKIFDIGKQHRSQSATTVVALLYHQGKCSVVWAGDSRLYRLNRAKLEKITTDHSDDDESSDTGKVGHSINRAIGIEDKVQLDSLFFSVDVGDRLLLCSDGVYNHVNGEEMSEILAIDSIDVSNDTLKKHILNTSANDNLTAITIDII